MVVSESKIGDWVAGQLQNKALQFAGANEEVYEIIDSLQTNEDANDLQANSTLGATISNDLTTLNQAEMTNDFNKWNFNVGVDASGPDAGGNLQVTSPAANDGKTNFHGGIRHYVGGEDNGFKTDPSTLGNVGLTHRGEGYNLNFNMNLGHRKPPEFNTNYQMNF